MYDSPQSNIIEPHNPPEVPEVGQYQVASAVAEEGDGLEKMVGFLNEFTSYIEKNPLIANLKSLIAQRDGLLKDLERVSREQE